MMESIIQTASSFAGDIDTVIIVIAVLGGIWLILAEAILFYFIFKFSRKNNPKAKYVTGEEHEAKKWIHWPHYLVIVCDIIIIFFAVRVWYNVKQVLPPAQATIRIIGQQWAWKFVHPGPDNQLGTVDDIYSVDELHVKVNTVYHFKLESEDVMHSFSVPVFRLKQDAVPGRVITGWFKPTKEGVFDLQCAEMCGVGHGVMVAKLFVESAEAHSAWVNKFSNNGSSEEVVNAKTDEEESK